VPRCTQGQPSASASGSVGHHGQPSVGSHNPPCAGHHARPALSSSAAALSPIPSQRGAAHRHSTNPSSSGSVARNSTRSPCAGTGPNARARAALSASPSTRASPGTSNGAISSASPVSSAARVGTSTWYWRHWSVSRKGPMLRSASTRRTTGGAAPAGRCDTSRSCSSAGRPSKPYHTSAASGVDQR